MDTSKLETNTQTIERLLRENAQLAAALGRMHTQCGDEDCEVCRLLEDNTVLRELLLPTIGLLEWVAAGPSGWTGAVGNELTRLRELCEKGGAK